MPDHRHGCGREAGHVDRRPHDQDERDARADAEQRGGDRQAHGEHGAERDQQDDHRREQADGLGGAVRRAGLEDVATEGDVQTGDVDAVRERLDLIAGVGQRVRVAVGKVHFAVRDVTALGDLARAVLGVRADDTRPAHDTRDLREQALHRAAHGRIVDALARLEDDLGLLARPGREALLLQQVERGLALGTGQLELGPEDPAGGIADGERADEQDDPGGEHPPPAPIHGVGERTQQWKGPW